MMNADKVEHRGLEAYQSIYNDAVTIVKNGKSVKIVDTTKRQTVEDMRRIIDDYLDGDANV